MMRKQMRRAAPKPIRKTWSKTNPVPSGRTVARKSLKGGR